MSLRLRWRDRNTIAVTTKIYRDTQPIDDVVGMTPITTITDGRTEFIDTSVFRGATYYYRFELTSDTDTVLSRNYEVIVLPRSGPGPQKIILGDHGYGFYGILPSSQFLSTLQLRAQLGLSIGTDLVAAPMWVKYAYNGKVYFACANTIIVNLDWNGLYANGLIYGTDDNGLVPNDPPVNQMRKVTHNGEEFIVRTPSGYQSENGVFELPQVNVDYTNIDTSGSEWDLFYYPMYSHTPPSQRLPNVLNMTNMDMANVTGLNAQFKIVREKSLLLPGSLTRSRSRSGAGNTEYNRESLMNCRQSNDTSNNRGWNPLLEYIPTHNIDL